MINMSGEVATARNSYVYRHIRLDTNQPFYVGAGTGRNYKRAKKGYIAGFITGSSQRSKAWNEIASKTKFEVEIIMDGLTLEEALKKEEEFIALYGRADKGLGPLCNQTDGGLGVKGAIKSEETIKKMSENIKKAMANVVQSEQQRIATGNTLRRLNKDAEFTKKRVEGIRRSAHKIAAKLSKKVVQLTMSGEVVKVWDSGHQVERETDFNRTSIAYCCKGRCKQYRGYKWQYFNNQ